MDPLTLILGHSIGLGVSSNGLTASYNLVMDKMVFEASGRYLPSFQPIAKNIGGIDYEDTTTVLQPSILIHYHPIDSEKTIAKAFRISTGIAVNLSTIQYQSVSSEGSSTVTVGENEY